MKTAYFYTKVLTHLNACGEKIAVRTRTMYIMLAWNRNITRVRRNGGKQGVSARAKMAALSPCLTSQRDILPYL